MTSGLTDAMLSRMTLSVILAFSLFGFLLIGGIILLIVLTVAAIVKMRKDDFWDEPMS